MPRRTTPGPTAATRAQGTVKSSLLPCFVRVRLTSGYITHSCRMAASWRGATKAFHELPATASGQGAVPRSLSTIPQVSSRSVLQSITRKRASNNIAVKRLLLPTVVSLGRLFSACASSIVKSDSSGSSPRLALVGERNLTGGGGGS